ncbi:MAG: exodeoxyribonuclease V subunit alpha [Pigmentiphaga sp.]
MNQQSFDFSSPSVLLRSPAALLDFLRHWESQGWLRPLDLAFAEFLCACDADLDPQVGLAATLVSHQLGHGHVCLALGAVLDQPEINLALPPPTLATDLYPVPQALLQSLSKAQWIACLKASPLVVEAAQASSRPAPLVLDEDRLYLHKYWSYEQAIKRNLTARLARQTLPADDVAGLLDPLFAPRADGLPDWQKIACAVASRRGFGIITGGPGTGKTTTVIRLLALLQSLALSRDRPLTIRMAAPTGKAAARLTASIQYQRQQLPVADEIKALIPTEVSTLHRLLGSLPDSRYFRHNADRPLALDVLVIDEASMVDLEMFALVLDALPPHAQLILLGDKDQLSSVEAGAILGDLCADAQTTPYAPATVDWIEAVTGCRITDCNPDPASWSALAQQTVMLRASHRFDDRSGIGQLAAACNAGEPKAVLALLSEAEQGSRTDLAYRRWQAEQGLPDFMFGAEQGFGAYTAQLGTPPSALDLNAWTTWAAQILHAFDAFRILCALRQGPYGVDALNERVKIRLFPQTEPNFDQQWFHGRPVMMTRNDYALGLMNGDIGMALLVPDALFGREGNGRHLRVAFPQTQQGGLRFLLPSRLSDVETVFAMTVHKSQGSEFDHACLVLPDKDAPLLTRELVYTAVTRAKRRFSLLAPNPQLLTQAVQRKTHRMSGLDARRSFPLIKE